MIVNNLPPLLTSLSDVRDDKRKTMATRIVMFKQVLIPAFPQQCLHQCIILHYLKLAQSGRL